MTTSALSATDRSDFKHVLVCGTKVGVITGIAVILSLVVARYLSGGLARDLVLSIIVLGAGVLASLLPAHWAVSRNTEGVAGAAAIGLWGTVVFMAIDIVLLRNVRAYPWTWDAIGGGSTWWYLPIWWMLGTYLAWMGGLVTAARNARETVDLSQLAILPAAGAIVLAGLAKLIAGGVGLPVLVGGGYTVSLTVLALFSLVRKA
jgi:hypothetical protein